MTIQFSASPDFPPKLLSGWFFLNTWMQHVLGEAVHFEPYNDFKSQRAAIDADKIGIIYANAYDAALLIREKGFIPIAKPVNKPDETLIVVKTASAVKSVEDLSNSDQIACTADPDVYMMGRIMLEPAELDPDQLKSNLCDSYVLVAKSLFQNDSSVGFFLTDAYNDLSSMLRKRLRVIVASDIQVIHHVFMLAPGLAEHRGKIVDALEKMSTDSKDKAILEALEIEGWAAMDEEAAEMMIDLMDTLNDYPLPS